MVDQHTVGSFDEELALLRDQIQQMGMMVQSVVALAKNALTDHQVALKESANEMDLKINSLDTQIEKKATIILALRQPKASDLRQVTSAIKFASTLERMGDLAKNSVKRTVGLSIELPAELLASFQDLSKKMEVMLEDILHAAKDYDANKAYAVWQRDDEVDNAYYALYDQIKAAIEKDSKHTDDYLQLLFAAKNMERFADHTTKLAKIVYYVSQGKRARDIEIAGIKLAQQD